MAKLPQCDDNIPLLGAFHQTGASGARADALTLVLVLCSLPLGRKGELQLARGTAYGRRFRLGEGKVSGAAISHVSVR